MAEELNPQEQEYQQFIKESVASRAYFKDALGWYLFRYVNPVCERTMLFFAAIITGISTYVLILIMKGAFPIVKKTPVVIKSYDASLYFPVIKKLRDNPEVKNVDEAVIKYLLLKYLKEREEYDFRNSDIEDLNRKFNVVKNNSSGQEYYNFQAFMNRNNALSPIVNFGKNNTRKIDINSFKFKRKDDNFADQARDFMSSDIPQEAEIRYDATILDNGHATTQKYLTKILYRFPGVEKITEGNNKRLNFIVVSYKTYKIN